MKTDQQMVRWALEESPEPIIKNPYLRLAFRGSMGTQAGTIPPEWDELSDREREYYRTGPWSTREDYRKGQLVQPGPGRQGYYGKKGMRHPNKKWGGNIPPIRKKDPARLKLYEFIKKNPKIEFETAQDLLKKANIENLTLDMANRTIQDLKLQSTITKTPAINFKTYDAAAKEYNQLLDDAIKNSDGTTLPKHWDGFLKSKNLKKSVYSTWKARSNMTVQKDLTDVKKQIVDNLVTEANRGLKYIEAQSIAKKSGFKTLVSMHAAFDGKGLFDRKKNALDLPEHKIQKAFDHLLSDMNKPVEDFFNPGLKISKATGLSNAAVSKNLNKYQPYLDEQRFMSNLRNDAVQTKITGKGLTLGEFYDHMQNRILVYEEAGKEMGKMGTIERRILEDAWRHTQQGGTKFEWVKKPGLDPSGNVTRWGEAKFRYKGKGSSGKLWNVDTLNINASEAPEFKEYFRVGKERNNY